MTQTHDPRPSAVIGRLNEAFARHHPQLLDGLLAPDCVLHTTGPAPAGGQVIGQADCQDYWGELIDNTDLQFLVEDETEAADVLVQRWRCVAADGSLIQRGLNVFTVTDGLISSADGYLKAGE